MVRPGVNQLSAIEWSSPLTRTLRSGGPLTNPHMATEVVPPQPANQELAQAVATMQRSLDQLQQQHALLTQALLNAVRGRWDAAQNGPQSVEAILVALSPGLQGKVDAVPFVHGR